MSEAGSKTAQVERWQAPEYAPSGAVTGRNLMTPAQLAPIQKLAREEGYQRGLAEGRKAGEAEVRKQAERLRELLATLEPQVSIIDDAFIEQVGDLVFAVAKQFIRREIQRQPGEVVRVVREAISTLPASRPGITVQVNAADAELLRDELSTGSGQNTVKVVEDPTIAPGGARIATAISVVDATIEARLGAIAAQIFGDERTQPE